jgi:hypothetical protein
MAETLTSAPHDRAHELMRARLRADLERLPAPCPIRPRGDAGNGSILLLAAAVPLILAIVYAAATLAGAVAGIVGAAGVQ